MTALVRAWIALAVLSAATTLIALSSLGAPWAGIIILAIAWAKARLIFLWYLELHDVPGWRGGILFGLALFMAVLFGLYVLA